MEDREIEQLRMLAKKYPVKFCNIVCKSVLGRELYDYQQQFIADTSKRICVVSGRQVGKTTAVALKAMVFAFAEDDKTVLVLSRSLRQSKIVFEKIRSFFLAFDFLADYIFRMTMNEIQLRNGSRIFCIPVGQTAEMARGYTADMIIVDEAAYVPDKVFEAMMPSLSTTDGYLILLGTPAGKSGFFYNAWCADGWSKYHIPSHRCPKIDEKFIEEYRSLVSEIEYKREILAEFIEISDLFFPPDIVERQMVIERRYSKPQKGFRYVAGLDVARFGRDENVLAIVGIAEDGHLELHNYYRRAKASLVSMAKFVAEKVELWNIERVTVDITGIGAGSYDILREILPKQKVKGITFTLKKRQEMYDYLLKKLENNELYLLNDKTLKDQFQNFECAPHSLYGVIAKKGRGKDDIVDALALAVYGARKLRRFEYLTKVDVDKLSFGGFAQWLKAQIERLK